MPTPIVGIDLGTTNSVIARVNEHGDPSVVEDENGVVVHPSIVSFHPNGSVVIGETAKKRRVIDPRNTVHSAKRLLGRTFNSPEVAEARLRMPYLIKEGLNELPVVITRAGEFAIPEISALLIDNLRYVACQSLGTAIDRAVVTVPANFNEAQRSATATAGAIAGITVVRVLNEPTAAAMAYAQEKDLNETLAVYDFGGGTFDVSILRIEGERFEVLGTAGHTFLGGEDVDETVVIHLADRFLQENGVDLRLDDIAMQRLRVTAERAKIELGVRSKARISMEEIAYGAGGRPLNFETELSREEFEALAEPVIARTFGVCDEALATAGLDRTALDNVLLVGGTTRIPLVRSQVADYFGRKPRTDIHPEKAVALGAAVQARALEQILDGNTEVTAMAPGHFESPEPEQEKHTEAITADDIPTSQLSLDSIPENLDWTAPIAPIEDDTAEEPPSPTDNRAPSQEPAHQIKPEPSKPQLEPSAATAAAEPQKRTETPAAIPKKPISFFDDLEGPPPGNSTALGMPAMKAPSEIFETASQALTTADLGGSSAFSPNTGPQVFDVTPHSLALRTVGGFCEPVMQRNQRVPARKSRTFSTSKDNQETVRIQVCQGESRRFEDNEILGDLVLNGLPARKRGEVTIEVTFGVNAGGLLSVHAVDTGTGIQQQANLELRGALSPEQIEASKERLRNLSH